MLSISVAIFAFNEQSSVMGRMKKYNEIEIVEELSGYNSTHQRNISFDDSSEQDSLKEYMKKNQLIHEDESDLKIQAITNNITNEKYYRLTGEGARIEVLQGNGQLRSYINTKPTEYIDGTSFDKEKITNAANDILASNELLKVNQNYKLIEIEESSTYYPTAWFQDNEKQKLMFIIFNPDSQEIMAIGTKAIPVSENNEIKIDANTAKNIAMKQVNLTEEYVFSIKQSEVVPNQMFLESGYYSNLNIKRNAYIICFDNDWKLQVYVDATTGEIIGGDGIW